LLVASAAATRASARWTPHPGTTWQWQLTVPVDLRVQAKVYDIDGFDNSAAVVRRLHARGRKVICYIDAGAYESYRPDASEFPPSVLGKADRPWAGERWLDVRRLDVLGPIMRARIDMCRAKGFDGVELDEVDGWSNDTGFPLTAADQLRYNRFLASEVHKAGLSAGLKNDLEQVRALLPTFDFAIDEQCYQYRECDSLRPFVAAGKAVFHTEYSRAPRRFCPVATKLGLSSMRKHLDLDGWRIYCAAPRAFVRGTRTSGRGAVVVVLACPGFSPCSGRVVLRPASHERGSIGRASFVIKAGARGRARVVLTGSGRQLLAAGPLLVNVLVTTRNGPASPTHSRALATLSG
jgi:hypothetical protein